MGLNTLTFRNLAIGAQRHVSGTHLSPIAHVTIVVPATDPASGSSFRATHATLKGSTEWTAAFTLRPVGAIKVVYWPHA